MAEIINLKKIRKDKVHREQQREAEANRLRFGRTKTQKLVDKQTKERETRAREDKKLE